MAAAAIAAYGATSSVAQTAPPTPPFSQCPAIGLNTSCEVLIVVNANGTASVLFDPSQGPYDGSDDSLVGVLNNSASSVGNIPITSGADVFGFDGDGICDDTIQPHPAGCPFGATGYEGPGTTFTNISA